MYLPAFAGPDSEVYLSGIRYYRGLENEQAGNPKPVEQLQSELMSPYKDAKTKGFLVTAVSQ